MRIFSSIIYAISISLILFSCSKNDLETEYEPKIINASSEKGVWEFEVVTEGIVIKSYLGSETTIVTPTTIDNINVVEIYNKRGKVFGNKVNPIRSIDLRNSIFLHTISVGSFSYTPELNSVLLPESLENIKYGAFEMSGVESLDLSKTSMKSIGPYAFSMSSRLKTVVLSSSIESIEQSAFSQSEIHTLDLSHTIVKSIGDYAFSNTRQLQTIIMSKNLESIGVRSFSRSSIEELDLYKTNLSVLGDLSLAETKNLKKVTLPNSLKKIKFAAFSESSISKIDLSNTVVTEIEDSAFKYCINFTELYLPENTCVMLKCGKCVFENTPIKSGVDNSKIYYKSKFDNCYSNSFWSDLLAEWVLY